MTDDKKKSKGKKKDPVPLVPRSNVKGIGGKGIGNEGLRPGMIDPSYKGSTGELVGQLIGKNSRKRRP